MSEKPALIKAPFSGTGNIFPGAFCFFTPNRPIDGIINNKNMTEIRGDSA
jgi:hypothetical protein